MMRAVYEIEIAPLSLNQMLKGNGRFVKDRFKRECFKQLSDFLEVSKTKIHVHLTKKGHKKFVYRKYSSPLFDIVNIKWQILFVNQKRRDLNNFIGGLKWIQDCLVDMGILTDDSTEHIENETYKIICPAKFTGIRVVIDG